MSFQSRVFVFPLLVIIIPMCALLWSNCLASPRPHAPPSLSVLPLLFIPMSHYLLLCRVPCTHVRDSDCRLAFVFARPRFLPAPCFWFLVLILWLASRLRPWISLTVLLPIWPPLPTHARLSDTLLQLLFVLSNLKLCSRTFVAHWFTSLQIVISPFDSYYWWVVCILWYSLYIAPLLKSLLNGWLRYLHPSPVCDVTDWCFGVFLHSSHNVSVLGRPVWWLFVRIWDPSHVPWLGLSVPFVVLLVRLCSGGSLFSCLGVSCGCPYVMHVPVWCRHSSGVSRFSWVSFSAFLQ